MFIAAFYLAAISSYPCSSSPVLPAFQLAILL